MIDQQVREVTDTRLRRAYGFEEVALVPGAVTADPAEVDLAGELGGHRLEIPFLAAAMDAVSDADFAVRLSRHGGVAFVNLEGLYTRYEDAAPIIVAKALEESALRMRTEARKRGIPIVENRPLARALHKHGKVGQVIPADLYRAVAAIIVHVMRLKGGVPA